MRQTPILMALAWVLVGSPLLAAYGDTVTVECKLNNLIAPGWVVISEKASSALSGNCHFPTKTYQILKDLNGAPLGMEEEVLGQSPIPQGWQIVQTLGTSGLDKFRYNIRYRIRKTQVAYTDTASSSSGPAVTPGQLLIDVASLDYLRQDMEKQYLAQEMKLRQDAERAQAERLHQEEVQALKERREPPAPKK